MHYSCILNYRMSLNRVYSYDLLNYQNHSHSKFDPMFIHLLN